jgi:multidrug efflux system membrane fusion protein
MMRHRTLLCSGLLLAGLLAGCTAPPGPQTESGPPTIPVSQPIEQEVTDYVDYTGRTDAVQSLAVRARVTGYLTKMPFKEGTEVKKDDLLFEIDPRPYQAQFDQAQGQVNLNQAQLKLAKSNYQRDLSLAPNNVSPQQLDYDRASVEEAEARIKAAQATLEVYRLNLKFCEVTAPIDGMVSRYYYTLGNLVNQDSTLLTTIVSLDPMYAYFDMDERTLLRVRRDLVQGKIQAVKQRSDIQVLMGLEGDEGFPYTGHLDFVNNAVNPSTATIAVRGVFDNPPLGASRRRLLSPGMFVRIRLPIGGPHKAILVADRAIGSDQGQKFVYVVDADNKAQYRRVTIGAPQDNGLRVIEDGLKPTDWVVTGGLQQVRSQMEIKPDRRSMLKDTGNGLPTSPSKRPQPPPPGEQKPLQPKTGAETSPKRQQGADTSPKRERGDPSTSPKRERGGGNQGSGGK